MPLTLLFLIYATTRATRAAEISTLDNPWGVLLIPDEPTALHSSTWRLCLAIDTGPLAKQMELIDEQWEMDSNFQKRVVTHPTGVDLVPVLRDTLAKARKEYKRLLFRMNARRINKEKRAAPVLGETGNFLSYLFGIAATDDTDRLQMEVNAIVNRQTALVNVQAKQLSTFHVIESSLAKQQREIDAQVNATQLLFHTVIKLYLDRFGPNTTQTAEHVHWQHQYLRSVTLFQDTVMEFHHAIDRAEDGFLTPAFLPRRQLEKALQQITDELPPGLGFPMSRENLPAYYETRICTFVPINGTLLAVVDLPLVNQSELYTPYRIHPFPSTDLFSPSVTVVTDKVLVFVNDKADRFVTYTERDPKPTCLFAKPPVCDVNGRFIETAPNDCISNIIAFDRRTGNGNFPHKACHFASTDGLPSTAVRISSTKWAIYAHETTSLQVHCPNQTTPEQSVIGAKLLSISSNCSATMGTILLPLQLRGRTNLVTTTPDQPLVPIRPPPFQPKPDVFSRELLDAFARHLHDTNHSDAQERLEQALTNLNNATADLGKIDVHRVNERLWASHGIDSVILLLVLVAGFIICCRCWCPLPCCLRTWDPRVDAPSAPMLELTPRPFGRESEIRGDD